MLLTALTVMGAAMDRHVRTKYYDYFQYPCLQLFVMALSAYRDLRNIRMGEVLSGTPQQLAPLIPSAENGLSSRHIFYYMPHGKKWLSQFDRGQKRDDDTSFFMALSINFMNILEKIQARGIIELRLSDDQMDDFDKHFSSYFEKGQLALNGELDSTVIRQAINAVRIMSIVAVLQEFEKHDGEGLTKALVMGRDPNGQDCNLFYLSISDDDFIEVLSIFECLYYHAIHVLSFLQSTETEHSVLAEPMIVLKEMPDEFIRQQWMDECEKHGISSGYAGSSLGKFKKAGAVISGDERGKYIKAVQDMKKIPRGRKVDRVVNECEDEK